MRNPFEYGGVVSGPAFCNRDTEVRDLVKAMENSQKLFVFSERRYGKTSLVRTALAKLPKTCLFTLSTFVMPYGNCVSQRQT